MHKKIDAENEKNAIALYQAYPKLVARAAALKAIRNALAKEPFEKLMEAVTAYAEARKGQPKTFTPHPATWFNDERWDDDRETWRESGGRYKPEPFSGLMAFKKKHEAKNDPQ